MRKVTRAGTTVFGARTSAEGRPLWDRRAKAVGISLWGSPRWLQFREMAGDGGTFRVSGSQRLEPMTSADNSRPSDPSRSGSAGWKRRYGRESHIVSGMGQQWGLRGLRGYGAHRPSGSAGWCLSSCVPVINEGAGALPAAWCLSSCVLSHPICLRHPANPLSS